MKLLNHLKQCATLPSKLALTLGNFDGVHRGHQALIASLCAQAGRLHLPTLVVLFEPQPSEYFSSINAPARLTSLREKLNILKDLKVDYVYCFRFNKTLAQMAPEDFAKIIFKSFNAHHLLVGTDFRFGKARQGNVDLLQTLGKQQGANVEIFPDFVVDDLRISSTSIRSVLQQGDLDSAQHALGRSYSLCGRVISGAKRGREWGIPTANITFHNRKLSLSGVFYVQVKRQNGGLYPGVANLGYSPTIAGDLKLTLETHIFEFNDNLYGERLEIIFLKKLREEIKFKSVEELIKQIREDIVQAKMF